MPRPISQEVHLKINKMIQEGMMSKDIAKLLGVHVRTVYRSVKKNRGVIVMSSPTELGGFLGYDPSGALISKKHGRYGPYVQAGSGQSAKRSNIIRGIKFEDVDLKMAMKLLTLPKVLGKDIEGKEILAHVGHPIYGPYVSCGDVKKSCGKISPFDITLEQATELLSKAKSKAKPQRQNIPAKHIKTPDYPLRDLVKAEEYVEQVGGFDRAVEILYAYLGYKEEREARK
jgi:topoisomerase IA-like protein